MLKGGRVERAVDAHIGAVMVVRWSGDGQAMATGSEKIPIFKNGSKII